MFGLLSSFDYQDEWKSVEKNAGKNPKTALEIVDGIEKHALQHKNNPQLLRCLFTRFSLKSSIEGISFNTKIDEIHKFQSGISDPVALAVSRYKEALLYADYYKFDRYKIDQRRELTDIVPDDVNEWSANLFRMKIRELVGLALNEPQVRTTLASEYEALIELGKESRLYRPTIYDFLVYDFLQNYSFVNPFFDSFSKEECVKMYDDLAQFHANDSDKSAYVEAVLSGLKCKHNCLIINDEEYNAALNNLLKSYFNEPASMLIRSEKARFLAQHFNDSDELRKRYGAFPADAIFLCEEGVQKFPDHPLKTKLKDMVRDWNRKKLEIVLDRYHVHKSTNLKLKVRYANITDLKISLSRFSCSADEFFNTDHKKLSKKKVTDFEFKLNKSDYCVMSDTVLEIPAQDYGAYEISAEEQSACFVVSDFSLLYSNHEQSFDFFVVDNMNGAPKKNVSFLLTDRNGVSKDSDRKTDANGEVEVDGCNFNDAYVRLADGKDDVFLIHFYGSRGYGLGINDNTTECAVSIMTDRAIYRPGQTVYFKCIAYEVKEQDAKVKADYSLRAVLYDSNYQKVSESWLQTNGFGSASSSFVIPASGKCGHYTLEVNDARHSIRVEEYKRPTFDVDLVKPDGAFSFDDTVNVKGKAAYLLGTPLQGAKVAYTVTRKPNYFFRWWPSKANEVVICEDDTMTDDEGNFTISFVPQKSVLDGYKTCYDYEVLAKVTDANGETHEQSRFVTVGDESMAICCPQHERLTFNDLMNVSFSVMNLNHKLLENTVSYKVMRDDELLASGQVLSSAKDGFSLKLNADGWASGNYTILFSATDDKGRTVENKFQTVLYRDTDKCPPVETIFWTENVNHFSVAPGEKKKVRVGSSCKDANLLVIKTFKDGAAEKKWYSLSNEIKDFEFALNKGDEVLNVSFFMVYDDVLYKQNLVLNEKKASMDIPVKLTVFRDKVLPGAKEKWQIQLPADKSAEVLAFMYDASLDQFAYHGLNYLTRFFKYYRFSSLQPTHEYGRSFSFSEPFKSQFVPFNFDKWRVLKNPSPISRRLFYSLGFSGNDAEMEESIGFGGGAMMKSAAPQMAKMNMVNSATVESVEEAPAADVMCRMPDNGGDAQISKPQQQMKVRTDFSETAFFYPHLTTDKEGNVNFEFTMPESLTEWSFMAYAHTSDLYEGHIEQKIVSQKDFMVSPNYPRFLRNGDECVLSAKVINLTDGKCSGVAKLQLLDPVTETVVMEKTADFTLEAGKNGAVDWAVSVPGKVEALLVRVSAVSGDFTDAEQKLLPVLSDRVVLTQSMPMYVRGGKMREYTFKNLVENKSASLNSRFLKLEMATNPVWYAVQALPSVAKADHENSISLSAAFFASKLAQHIANSNPRVFNVIELWKQQGADKQSLLSNLEKNNEVKNVLLNETPWVLDAKNETENKQRLSSLFDLNTIKANCGLWLKKLTELQTNEGGFAWFKGMDAGLHSTLFVLDNFGRLSKAGIPTDVDQSCIRSAVEYTDEKLREDFERLKKYDKDYKKNAHLFSSDLYYFQVRTMFSDIPVKAKCKEAYDFYFSLVEKQWADFGLYGKALAAICLYQNGNQAEAMKVVRSLREFSTSSDEMGMYWARNSDYYLWDHAPVGTHTRIMEALQMIDPNQAEQDELRIWLLNQKRTQNWDNTIANIDALNVLLLGSTWLDHENHVTVKMGDKLVEPEQAEAATGYYSVFVPGSQISQGMGKVQLQSAEGDNLAWGAVYWQFEEDMDKVVANNTGLSIEKNVMLQIIENGKEALKSIDSNSELKVGDKLIVRLVLRSDRDLDYVALKDQRAACLEPMQTLSGYRYSEHCGYYQSVKDAAMYYFFNRLRKGTYVFEYPLVVTNRGQFSNGITSVQCLYAPEFSTNTGSVKIVVK